MKLAVVQPRQRFWLYASIAALLCFSAAISAISAGDPDGAWLRVGMILMTVGAGFWLPWPALLPAIFALWLGPNIARGEITNAFSFETSTILELPGLIGLGLASAVARVHLRGIEEEPGLPYEAMSDLDEETGVYRERFLREALERELARSRRFSREFTLMLAGVDRLTQRFDYRDEAVWSAALRATADVLKSTRTNIDQVYRFGDRSFALVLPETGPRDIRGLVRRLSRAAKKASPSEGAPGGPLATHFGVTFFPHCATSVEDMLRRAEIALHLAAKSPTRLQVDGAEAPGLPSPETLRRLEHQEAIPESWPSVAVAEAMVAVDYSLDEDEAEVAAAEERAPQAEPTPIRPMVAEPVMSVATEEPEVEEPAATTPVSPLPAPQPEPVAATREEAPVAPVKTWPEPVALTPAASMASPTPVAEPTPVVTPAPAPAVKSWPEPAVLSPAASIAPVMPPAPAVTPPRPVTPPAPIAQREPVSIGVANGQAAARPVPAAPVPMSDDELDRAMAELKRHVDDTLQLIRTMKDAS